MSDESYQSARRSPHTPNARTIKHLGIDISSKE
jgi:hypothetical protein